MLLRSMYVFLGLLLVVVSGIGKKAQAFDGYILAGGHNAGVTLLLDENKDTVHIWDHSQLTHFKNGYSSYLMKDGTLLRTAVTPGGEGDVSTGAAPLQGIINAIDPDGKLLWTYALADKKYMLHHDFKIMPNGNLLVVSFVKFSKDSAIDAGIDSSLFNSTPDYTFPDMSLSGSTSDGLNKTAWGPNPTASNLVQLEKIMEVKPDKSGGNNHEVVWEWNIADHIIPKEQASQHPEKFSGSLGPIWFDQWVHLNGIDFNPTKNLILFTSRIFSEVFVIDHSTTTAEAATGSGGTHSKGGDILYRWGNAANYGASASKTIVTLHCPTWIPEGYDNAGDIMFFHNNAKSEGFGFSKIGNSEVVQITPPFDASGKIEHTAGSAFGPTAPSWTFSPSAPDTIFSMSMSSAIRMKNGNTIVHEAFPPDTASNPQPGNFGQPTYGTSRIREARPDGTLVGEPFYLDCNAAKIMYYEKNSPEITALLDPSATHTQKVGSGFTPATIIHNKYGITVTNAKNVVITLLSLQGKRIAEYKSSISNYSISTKSLSTGTYLFKIQNAKGVMKTGTVNVM